MHVLTIESLRHSLDDLNNFIIHPSNLLVYNFILNVETQIDGIFRVIRRQIFEMNGKNVHSWKTRLYYIHPQHGTRFSDIDTLRKYAIE